METVSTNIGSNYDDTVIPLLSLFEAMFSIDWVVELTGIKPSYVLTILENLVKDGCAVKGETGEYCLIDAAKKQELITLISHQTRMQLNRKIVDILIRDLEDNDHKYLTLAHHLLQIQNDSKKCELLMKAGNLYLKRYETEKALGCYSKILADLKRSKNEDSDLLYSEAAIQYSKFSAARHDTPKVISILKEAILRSRYLEKKELNPLIEMHLAKNEWFRSRYAIALKHFDHAWSKCKALKSPKLLQSAANFSTFFHFWQGRYLDSIASYEESVSDIDNYPKGSFPLFSGLLSGYCYALTGQVTQGLGMLYAFQKVCEERGNEYLKCQATLNIGVTLAEVLNIDEASHHLHLSVKQARQNHNNWVVIMGTMGLAYTYYLNNDYDQSSKYLQRALLQMNKVHVSVLPVPYLLELSWAIYKGEFPKLSELSFETELKKHLRAKSILLKGVAYRYKAFQQKEKGLPHEESYKSLKNSERLLKESGVLLQLAKTQLELSRYYLDIQKIVKAKELATNCYGILTPMNEKLFPNDLRNLVPDGSFNEQFLKDILNLGKEIVTIRDIKKLVQKIMSTVNKLTGAERGAIFLVSDDSDFPRLRLRASKNLTSSEINHQDFLSSLEMIDEVARKGEGIIRRDKLSQGSVGLSKAVIRSQICVPMLFKNKVVGVLYHDNRLLSNVFRESDLELLSYFAALAAFAMDNASIHKENERLNHKLKEENLYYEQQTIRNFDFEKIIGKSPAVQKVLTQIQHVAHTDSTVLIQGETGVGKELVARAIHLNSKRKNKPFIAVQCSALPKTLIQSELFGHERGAFTNANERRTGRFELADGGTLFLDEIGDIPLEIQMQLLRVLQNKEFERLGGTETIRSNFRLIAATNNPLENQIENNTFRKDLFYRLNVFPIHVPPLRDRKQDIPLLAEYFTNRHSKKLKKQFNKISNEDLDVLTKYEWPGNIRELKNVIERYCILSKEPYLTIPKNNLFNLNSSQNRSDLASYMSLSENERHYILKTLKKTGWKVSGRDGAAELLKVNPSTLTFRIKKLGIKRPEGFPKRRRAIS